MHQPDPSTASQLITRAHVELGRGDRAAALRCLQSAAMHLGRLPADEVARFADACRAADWPAGELEARTLLVAKVPRWSAQWWRLVRIHRALGDQRASRRAARRALHLTPPRRRPPLRPNRGRVRWRPTPRHRRALLAGGLLAAWAWAVGPWVALQQAGAGLAALLRGAAAVLTAAANLLT